MSSTLCRSRRNGFALLTVLFGVAILSVLLAASLQTAQTNVLLTKHAIQTRVDAPFLEGLMLVAARLAAEGGGELADAPAAIEIAGQPGEVRLQNPHGLFDVNKAELKELELLFQVRLGEPGERLAKELLESRNRLKPWQSVQEVRRLRLMSAEQFARIQPYLTVYSSRAKPNRNVMSASLRDLIRVEAEAAAKPTSSRTNARSVARILRIDTRSTEASSWQVHSVMPPRGSRRDTRLLAFGE